MSKNASNTKLYTPKHLLTRIEKKVLNGKVEKKLFPQSKNSSMKSIKKRQAILKSHQSQPQQDDYQQNSVSSVGDYIETIEPLRKDT